MAHKDLSDDIRGPIVSNARAMAEWMHMERQSLALAREAWINAFDRVAEELEATDAKNEA